MPASTDRPLRDAAIIGLAAQALFMYHLTRPDKLVFDETHYVPAARTLMTFSGPANIEHPLLGKLLIGTGMLIFGDNPIGWRMLSTFAATAVIMGVFAILWLLFGRTRTAVMGSLFVALNLTVFVQARIAMLDGFMAAFVIGAIAALLWAMRAPPRRVWPRWLLGAVLLGLAMGTKWVAVPYLGYAGIAFIAVRVRDSGRRFLSGRDQRHWPGLATIPALLTLGLVSLLVYFLTFLPAFFYASEPLSLARLLPFQLDMYAQQTQVLPPHTYQSSWWSWPLMIRPIWYLYEPVDGAVRGILLIGNPAILWGGLLAVLACLYAWWRDRAVRPLAVALLWAASYLMWAIIPKSLGFFYYYYVSSILICLPLAAAFDYFGRGARRHWDEAFLILSVGLFAYFYPIVSAAALPGPQAFHHWMWFPSWP